MSSTRRRPVAARTRNRRQQSLWDNMALLQTVLTLAAVPPPPVPLGLPTALAALPPRGSLTAHRPDGASVRCERVSGTPWLFHLRGLLSDAEAEHIMARAQETEVLEPMTAGRTAGRQRCSLRLLPPADDPVLRRINRDVAELLLSAEARAAPGGGVEDLQVLCYEEGGSYTLHYDASPGTPRALTVLYFLNGEGSTWFPLAHDDPAARPPRNRAEAIALSEGCVPARDGAGDGAVLSPQRGDAIAFYNLLDDGGAGGDGSSAVGGGKQGSVDLRTLHAGLPAARRKWIASHWFRLGDRGAPPSSRQQRAASTTMMAAGGEEEEGGGGGEREAAALLGAWRAVRARAPPLLTGAAADGDDGDEDPGAALLNMLAIRLPFLAGVAALGAQALLAQAAAGGGPPSPPAAGVLGLGVGWWIAGDAKQQGVGK